MTGALDGIRVLDLSRHLAGPYCAMMLGDLGAEVIKVERPGVGDETRQWGPPFVGGESAYYLCCNRNKKGLTLNLRRERGVALARELARRSDVLIENFRVGGAEELGLGYEDLRAINPRLVTCSISGFGHTGPDRDLGGYDFMIQGRGGLMSITGERDPLKVGVAVVDVATALFACNAVLAALFARQRTGVGQRLDLALLDSAIALLANVGSNYICSGQVPERWGNAHASIVPYQAFHASDGHLILAVGNDGQWRRFCAAAGVSPWAEDPRFGTNPSRVAHRETLVPLLEELFRQRTVADWLRLCAEADVPAGPVNTLDRVFSDPQALARGMLVEMPHPAAGVVRLTGTPLHLSATPAQMRLPPPLLGEHTDEILTRLLGLDEGAMAELRREGVV
ncbi:MAG: formyl-CoA transferase [Candidatus Handelsmanbacteria bacterium RIFCSPLOWO2_12_FULL_64_10]|uniref:Formyl-CoA transferase n=1 Tax=Handelsmanbacteria sp. (strain RIFCSPLOWO2_12_FULL_64_10) TaxID=1817868 RepID=A0A1F6CYC9_HANXR|nr:MAG: formyl-CoA transferase [Candidatus Handelsmanbacteria bacterium RIFCSPLOWO2_12_FULL_64_10]